MSAKKFYHVTGQIELDGTTHAKGSVVELSDEQATQAPDAVAYVGDDQNMALAKAKAEAEKAAKAEASKAAAKA